MRFVWLALAGSVLGCPKSNAARPDARADSLADATSTTPAPVPTRTPIVDATPPEDLDARAPIDASDDAMALHHDTKAGLLELFPFDAGASYLSWSVGYGAGKINQGNRAISSHSISQRACLEGLRDVVIQTPEQRERCGADYMVPIYEGGDPSKAKYCIDQFEYPNVPCELPVVWITPAQAQRICGFQGKRLCTQQEWNLSCRADPAGGPDRVYAYGDELDMTICNTNKPHPMADPFNWKCWVKDAQTAWETCGTDTEPNGSFPKCRSRFGVYDLEGNVAEIMTRKEGDVVYTQLKGSAFFYVDVARKHNVPHDPTKKRDTYPDHCNYDPRWHVEKLDEAMHMNYHLGFRCCRSL